MNNYFESAVKTLCRWIKIKSVKSAPQKNMPFGENIYKMLNLALGDAEQLGFKVINYDNYIGEVIFGEGNDEDGVAILCHLDVVPEGDLEKWTHPAYLGEVVDGEVYGRGVLDDKGPAALCLYALKQLKDCGFTPKRKIKLIFGCDEESGNGCIEHYNKVAIMPRFGFSPDAEFPVIYAEKGILHVEYSFEKPSAIIDIFGGNKVNMVCDSATCVLNKNILAQDDVFVIENKIFAKGISAHGSTPQKGVNAIKKLLFALSNAGVLSKEVYCALFENEFYKECDHSGEMTFSPNLIYVKNNEIKVAVDVRYPVTYSFEKVKKLLEKVGRFTVLNHSKPLFHEEKSSLVETLLGVYNNQTGNCAKPISIGGGTYARALKTGVAFGPAFKEEHVCHVANEKMNVNDLKICYNIYIEAIKQLAK